MNNIDVFAIEQKIEHDVRTHTQTKRIETHTKSPAGVAIYAETYCTKTTRSEI